MIYTSHEVFDLKTLDWQPERSGCECCQCWQCWQCWQFGTKLIKWSLINTSFNISTTLQLLLNMSDVNPTQSLFIVEVERTHTHQRWRDLQLIDNSNNMWVSMALMPALSPTIVSLHSLSYLESNYAFNKIWHIFCHIFST